jgi:hypothetical protein
MAAFNREDPRTYQLAKTFRPSLVANGFVSGAPQYPILMRALADMVREPSLPGANDSVGLLLGVLACNVREVKEVGAWVWYSWSPLLVLFRLVTTEAPEEAPIPPGRQLNP